MSLRGVRCGLIWKPLSCRSSCAFVAPCVTCTCSTLGLRERRFLLVVLPPSAPSNTGNQMLLEPHLLWFAVLHCAFADCLGTPKQNTRCNTAWAVAMVLSYGQHLQMASSTEVL